MQFMFTCLYLSLFLIILACYIISCCVALRKLPIWVPVALRCVALRKLPIALNAPKLNNVWCIKHPYGPPCLFFQALSQDCDQHILSQPETSLQSSYRPHPLARKNIGKILLHAVELVNSNGAADGCAATAPYPLPHSNTSLRRAEN